MTAPRVRRKARPPASAEIKHKKKVGLRSSVVQVYRDAILEAAERVFGQHGFEAAKMTDVAKEAGVGAGTLYNYFASKREIFESLVEYRTAEMFERFAPIAAQPDASAVLIGMVRAVFAYMEEHRAMFGLFLELGARAEWSIGQVGGKRAGERYAKYLELLTGCVARASEQGLLREDLTHASLVAILTGSMNGVVHAWLAQGSSEGLSHQADLIVEVFLNGARRQRR